MLSGCHRIKLLEKLIFRIHFCLRPALARANSICPVRQEEETGKGRSPLCGDTVFLHNVDLQQSSGDQDKPVRLILKNVPAD